MSSETYGDNKEVYCFWNAGVIGQPGWRVFISPETTFADVVREITDHLPRPRIRDQYPHTDSNSPIIRGFLESTGERLDKGRKSLYDRVTNESIILVETNPRKKFEARVDLSKPPEPIMWEVCLIL